jgi:isopenicillin-N N-acyltransferase-like protein
MKKRSQILLILLLLLSVSAAIAQGEASQLEKRGNLRILELQGTHYEKGKAHGQTLKPEIQELIKRWKANIEKSFSVPAEAYIRKLLEASDFEPAIERWTPGLLDEVHGIADGAGIDFQTMYAYQLIDETWVMSDDLDLSKCTTIGAGKRGNTPAFVAQNLDIPSFYHGFQAVLRIHGSEGEPDALVFTIPGIVAANGLNDRSIGVCVNAVTQLAYSVKGLPVDFVIRGILRQKTYADAVRFLKEIQPAAPQNYVLGGPDVVVSLERSAARIVEFLPFKDAEFTYHTNHPVVNDDLNPRFVERLRAKGTSLDAYKAICPRFRFLADAFKDNSATLDLDVLKRVFANREARINNAGTYGCTIMVLGARPELHIAAGRPDEVPFEVFGFEPETSR